MAEPIDYSKFVVSILEEGCEVYVGRPTKWGNPYRLLSERDRPMVVEKFKQFILKEKPHLILEAFVELRGKTLGCYCKPRLCHADFWSVCANCPDYFYLCMNCGVITPFELWGLFKRNEEGDLWIPVEPGDGDPMCKCPHCDYEHRDIDDDAGIYDGTLETMIAERGLVDTEQQMDWIRRLAERP